MTIKAEFTLWCDAPGCPQWGGTYGSISNIKAKARASGWTVEDHGRAWCPEHVDQAGNDRFSFETVDGMVSVIVLAVNVREVRYQVTVGPRWTFPVEVVVTKRGLDVRTHRVGGGKPICSPAVRKMLRADARKRLEVS